MLNHTMVKMFEASEVFNECYKSCGRDIEGILNETLCPPQDGAVCVSLPIKDEEFDANNYSAEEMILYNTLHKKGGLNWGDWCYLSYNY